MLKMGDDGVLQVISNKFNNAHIGVSGHGHAWSGFSHASAGGAVSYGFLHHKDGIYSLINKKSGGGHIGFRRDNHDMLKMGDDGVLQVISNKFNNAHIGVSGHGPGWAGFSHASAGGKHNYGFLHHKDGIYSLINKKSGSGHIGFRVDNADVVTIKDGGAMWVGGNITGPTIDSITQQLKSLHGQITTLREEIKALRGQGPKRSVTPVPAVVATPVPEGLLPAATRAEQVNSVTDLETLKRAKIALDAGVFSLEEYELIKKRYLEGN